MKINAKNKSVLIIGDMHVPYEHVDYLDFCKAVSKKYKCEIIINAGDEVDNHAVSFHDSISELYSAGHELDLSIIHLKEWYKAFPKMLLLESNHGSLYFRKLKHHGVPIRTLKPLNELLEVKKWRWFNEIELSTSRGDVFLCHGRSANGIGFAKSKGCSVVQGHYHTKFEIVFHESGNHSIYSMFVGCGVNRDSLAFEYARSNVPDFILGCGVIDKCGTPKIIKMHLNKKGRWVGKI